MPPWVKIRIDLGLSMKNKNKKEWTNDYSVPTTTNFYFGTKTFNIILICLIILTGFLYLSQVNASAVKGYIIRDLEMKLEEAKVNYKDLELESQAHQSVGGMAAKAQELGMVGVENVEYIQLPGGEVAVVK